MEKIKVKNPVVELDGDEMARVIWGWIREELILPYLDIDLKYFDYHILNRDKTENGVILDAVEAIKKYRVGAKCAAINPDQSRVKEFGLKKAWKSPNSATRNRIGGTLFRQPIVMKNIPRVVPGWIKPIVVARHGFGDLFDGADFDLPAGRQQGSFAVHPPRRRKARRDRGLRHRRGRRRPGHLQHRGVRPGLCALLHEFRPGAGLSRLSGDQEHGRGTLRRPVQGHLPGSLRDPVQGTLRGQGYPLRAPHGG